MGAAEGAVDARPALGDREGQHVLHSSAAQRSERERRLERLDRRHLGLREGDSTPDLQVRMVVGIGIP